MFMYFLTFQSLKFFTKRLVTTLFLSTFVATIIKRTFLRPKKIEDKKLILNLMSVLRKKGYEGSSLNQLAQAANLNKASLYHRFPGGKKEITDAVLDFADEWVKVHIYKLLSDSSIPPIERLQEALKLISEDLYDHGHEMCLLRALSMDAGQGLFGSKIKGSMTTWIKAFTLLGIDFGFTKEEANDKAVQVLVHIQGGLVVSESIGSVEPFKAVLVAIEKLYLKE
ncbi:TetR/AcrR family transcriptional regulator [Flagellimonas aquimarina]|uniref:TetR/AcrR family transcriptional regulator n=1 Tax=Flagellimonas aquimarina TaxID=2201895 RepID=A0A316L2Z1_9FLAO|nr:TetR/AcrR family transcriptional regulator [Allomuricauda koreensis]